MPQSYRDSLEHLRQELDRLDLMLRRAVIISREAHPPTVPPELRGAVISDPQIDSWLSRPGTMSDYWNRQSAAREQLLPVEGQLAALRSEIEDRWRLTMEANRPPALPRLAECFALSPAEIDLLLIAAAPELEPEYETLYGYLQDDATRKRPSVNLALNLICRSQTEKVFARRLLSDGSPLIYFHLIQLIEEPFDRQSTFLRRFLKIDEAVLRYLLEPMIEPPSPPGDPTEAVSNAGVNATVRSELLNLLGALRSGSAGPSPVIHLVSDGHQPLEVAEAIGRSIGRVMSPISLNDLATNPSRAVLAVRDAAMTGSMLVITTDDRPLQDADRQKLNDAEQSLWAAQQGARAPVVLVGPAQAFQLIPSTANLWRLDIPKPDFEQRKVRWARSLADTPAVTSASILADAFTFSPDMVRRTAQLATRLAQLREPAGAVGGGTAAPTYPDVLAAARSLATPNLSRFALPVIPRYEWHDLVLPADKKQQLKGIVSRVANRKLVHRDWGFGQKLSRGKGLTVLFTGPSGTGKTMAAEVLAGRLSLILYQIDLSTVISKYIGETEQHLAAIFREAESSQALLFFDEAEACFGKRTEVKDAHDRYANIEVNYLLQRLEQYEGIVVLATNLYRNLDEAFLRRISEVIEFPLPDEALRRTIWENHFPPEAELSSQPRLAIDFPFLAKNFKLTGGSIKNVALNAAFAAAPNAIDMSHVVRAVRAEFQKQGKLAMESEFGEYLELLKEKPNGHVAPSSTT